jgi:hypothetical protein
MRTAIVAGGNARPVFDPAEAVFDFMPLFVEDYGRLRLFFVGMQGRTGNLSSIWP